MECFSLWAWNVLQPTLISTQAAIDRAGLWLWFVVDQPAERVCLVGMMVGV